MAMMKKEDNKNAIADDKQDNKNGDDIDNGIGDGDDDNVVDDDINFTSTVRCITRTTALKESIETLNQRTYTTPSITTAQTAYMHTHQKRK